MPVTRPTHAQLREVAEDFGLHLSAEDIESYRALLDSALAAYDLIQSLPDELPPVRYPRMPGAPMKAMPLPPADAPRALQIRRAFEVAANTCSFDATGHPAMSLPCGMSGGPAGWPDATTSRQDSGA